MQLPSPRAALLGVPYDAASSYRRGAAAGPAAIRAALHAGAMNLCTEDGLDLAADSRWRDAGDVPCPEGVQPHAAIVAAVGALLAGGERPLVLGGDHSITFPVVEAVAARVNDLTILHLDAHSDLYETFDGDPWSHACPFARIMERNLVRRLVQVGIRTLNPHQREQAQRFGVEVVEMRAWAAGQRLPRVRGAVYLSLDLDALDPACAPGVAHPEPGGLTTREVLTLLQGLPPDVTVVAADLMELNPSQDPSGITAALGAKLTKELLALMLRSNAAAG